MKNKHIFKIALPNKQNKGLVSNVLFISIVVGFSIGYFFLRKNAINKNEINSTKNSYKLKNDLRKDDKKRYESLLGKPNDRNNPTKINVTEAGTLNWRKNRDQSMFPPIPDPNIRIN